MSIQNTKESESKNIEQNNINKKIEAKSENLPKSEILKKYDNYELFLKNIEHLDKDKKEKLLKILSKISDDDLIMTLEINNSGSNLIEFKDIDNFIEENKNFLQNEIKSDNGENRAENVIFDKMNVEKINKESEIKTKNIEKNYKSVEETSESAKETSENVKNNFDVAQGLLNKNSEKYKKVFIGTEFEDTFLSKINKINKLYGDDNKKEEYVKAYQELVNWLEENGNAQKIFNTISNSKNISEEDKKSLYTETYNIFVNLGVRNLPKNSELPPVIIIPDPRFPDAPEGKVEKRGDLLTYGDKLIDEKTGKAYILGENGYKLETSLNIPNLTETKVKFQKERLEILESLDTSRNILNLLENKYTIKNRIKNLEKEKTGIIGEDTQKNIEINLLSKELEQIQNKLKQVVPNYNETQDDLLKSFLEKSIKEDNEKLEKLEERYTKEIKDLYEKAGNNVKENDEKTRETLNILDSIGFTLIPKNITDDIIATINKNPENYGFESRIDLKNGNFGGINNQLTKERFIKKINKMISSKETEPITTNEIDDILVKKIEKDKNSQEERNKELLGKFSTYGIINDLGIWDKEKLESNLTLKEKETTNKETK